VFALDRSERHTLLSVLEDPPDGLVELRVVLRRELAAYVLYSVG